MTYSAFVPLGISADDVRLPCRTVFDRAGQAGQSRRCEDFLRRVLDDFVEVRVGNWLGLRGVERRCRCQLLQEAGLLIQECFDFRSEDRLDG